MHRMATAIPAARAGRCLGAFGPAADEVVIYARQADDFRVLVASLRPFVFDPLVDWVVDDERRGKGGKKAGKGADPTGEVVNETGVETLKAIETDKLSKPWAWPDIEELEAAYGNIPGYTTAKKNAEAGICRW